MKDVVKETADTILEKDITVELAGKTYNAKRPTLATLIEVSRLISELPNIELFDTDSITSEKIVEANKKGLFYAKNCEVAGLILATLILGYKKRKRLSKLYFEWKRMRLALRLVNDLTIDELIKSSQKLLTGLDAASFFVFIASLSAVNLMGEAMKTTPSGQ